MRATGGPFINPAANVILADTTLHGNLGPLPLGRYTVSVFAWSVKGNQLIFEHRNNGNTGTLFSQIFETRLEGPRFVLEVSQAGERFRVLNRVAFTGEVQATIVYELRALAAGR